MKVNLFFTFPLPPSHLPYPPLIIKDMTVPYTKEKNG